MEDHDSRIWRVSGNMDQIKKHGLDKGLSWEQTYPDEAPNRVHCKIADKMEACDLYNKMRGLKMVVLRNWLD